MLYMSLMHVHYFDSLFDLYVGNQNHLEVWAESHYIRRSRRDPTESSSRRFENDRRNHQRFREGSISKTLFARGRSRHKQPGETRPSPDHVDYRRQRKRAKERSDEPRWERERLGRGERASQAPPSMRMPLNSKRLKAGHLRRLAAALGVPTAASADELRQMIDGKLTEEGKEVRNVQVVLGGADPTSEFALEDEEGRFLIVPATEEENRRDGEEQDANILKRELDTLAEENQSLKAEVSGLKDKLHEEKARIRDLWRTNCQCMAEYDDEIAAKDNEIEELRHQLSSRSEVHSVLPHTAETRVRGDTRTGEEPLQPQGSRAHPTSGSLHR